MGQGWYVRNGFPAPCQAVVSRAHIPSARAFQTSYVSLRGRSKGDGNVIEGSSGFSKSTRGARWRATRPLVHLGLESPPMSLGQNGYRPPINSPKIRAFEASKMMGPSAQPVLTNLDQVGTSQTKSPRRDACSTTQSTNSKKSSLGRAGLSSATRSYTGLTRHHERGPGCIGLGRRFWNRRTVLRAPRSPVHRSEV